MTRTPDHVMGLQVVLASICETMKAIVDYRNVPRVVRGNGLRYIADRIMSAVVATQPVPPRDLEIRLYSGWDRGMELTQEAQALGAESQRDFPYMRTGDPPTKITVELVHWLEALPKKRLHNKLRLERVRDGIRFQKPSATTCNNADCPIDNLYDFFREGRCPIGGCAGTVAALASQEQQKLVDTMMVADVIYLAQTRTDPICIVSSDDDLWPGILSALALGREIIHVSNAAPPIISPYLVPNLGTYKQRSI